MNSLDFIKSISAFWWNSPPTYVRMLSSLETQLDSSSLLFLFRAEPYSIFVVSKSNTSQSSPRYISGLGLDTNEGSILTSFIAYRTFPCWSRTIF